VTTTHFQTFILLGLLTVLGAAHVGRGAEMPVSAIPLGSASPDVWLINTRGLPNPCSQHGISKGLRFQRLDGNCFVATSQQEFLSTLDPTQTTCFFVHGNRMTASDARNIGLSVRRQLDRTETPFRYVIWSWPSERITGMIRDARSKAERADGESYYLASVLAALPAEADVSLIGYSFGARAITGGLHLLGGGMVNGNSLSRPHEQAVRPRVILMAAAVPRSWLLPGGTNGLAPFQVEQMLLLYNPRDPALKHFPIVFGPGHPQALGFEGISRRQLGPTGGLMEQYNVAKTVGRSHSLSKYTRSAGIMGTIRRSALPAPAL
jgi:hypothetical protein